MRKNFQGLCFAALFALGVGWSTPALSMEDGIVAIVNNDVITLRDLQEYINSVYLQLKTEDLSPQEIKAAMQELQANGIQKLIEDKLVLTEANQKNIEVPANFVDRRLEEIKAKYNSEDEFLNGLLSDGATVTDLRNRIRDQLKMKFLIDQEVRAKIFVNPQEVTEYYHKNSDRFQKPERLKVESIYVRKAANTDAKEKAKQAIEQIKAGKNFLETAREYSDSPSIGMIEKGQLRPVVEQVIFKLAVDEVSEVVEVNEGFYIFKVTQKFPAAIASLEEMKNKIYNDLFFDKYVKRLRKWIDKLKANAFIEIKSNL